MSKEAMKLALEALKQMQAKANFECWNLEICDKAIKALEEALAKQEQGEHYKGVIEGVQKLFDDKRKPKQEQGEPVAWDLKDVTDAYKLGAKSQQRTWVGLTDEEIMAEHLETDVETYRKFKEWQAAHGI